MNKPMYLTKSSYVIGLQCSKWIWLKFNDPSKLPLVDEATQHRFDEGHKVGELAKSLFPEGIEVKEQLKHTENEKESLSLLSKRKPLFEAGFIDKEGRCYSRADVIAPVEKDSWDIYEVKSGTKVKDENIWDIAFQKYCYESKGVKIRKCFHIHVNNEYVRKGEINAKEFFVIEEISERVNEEIVNVEENIKKLFKIIESKTCPEIEVGNSCCLGKEEYEKKGFDKIHESDKFWKEHPECDVLDLYRGGKKSLELFNKGILEIGKLEGQKLNDKQQIQFNTHKTGKPHIDKVEIKKFIKSLKYPLYFLDFESYMTAIPIYDGLKPYQQIPFQFSLHIVEKKGAKPKHISFIAEGSGDPRPKFLEELKENLGGKGSIIIYNQSFEQTILRKLGEHIPDYQNWINSLTERMVDLLMPFRNFAYYHPKQHGSASIKYVLPVLTDATYKDFEIANGSQASLSYLYITHGSHDGKKATPQEIKKVRADLEEYCGLDTLGMVLILDKLNELIK